MGEVGFDVAGAVAVANSDRRVAPKWSHTTCVQVAGPWPMARQILKIFVGALSRSPIFLPRSLDLRTSEIPTHEIVVLPCT